GGEGGEETRLAARDPGPAELHHRLRHVERNDDTAPQPLRNHRRDRREVGFRRQRGESAIDELAGGLGVDVADDGDLEVVARKRTAGITSPGGDGGGWAPL